MLRNRIIPCLLLQGESLVKTIQFKNPNYIGDAINTVRIFNELEVDELVFLDIEASPKNKPPNYKILKEIASECFMPLAYGGGITNLNQAEKIIEIGFEKIIINSGAFENHKLIPKIVESLGRQSVVGSIDVKTNFFGKKFVTGCNGKKKYKISPEVWAEKLVQMGIGELLVTSIDFEGTWKGLDHQLLDKITKTVNVPVIANGGTNSIEDIQKAFNKKCSAVALGNMVVYQKKDMGVLINYPNIK